MLRTRLSIVLVAFLLLAGWAPANAAPPERADVVDQGGGGVYAANGAKLVRQANGIAASVSMPTPEPGTYGYPVGTEPGHPEVFTLWMFVFNHPEHCATPFECGPSDFNNENVKFGVYNPAGHVTGGGKLTLSGRVGVGDEPEPPPPGVDQDFPLSNPAGAEIHLAVTSHGALDPATLPEEFRIPTGPPDRWWVALFR